jgi:hypothetical protein
MADESKEHFKEALIRLMMEEFPTMEDNNEEIVFQTGYRLVDGELKKLE